MNDFITIKVSRNKFKRMFNTEYDDFVNDDTCDELEVSATDKEGTYIIAIVKKNENPV